MIEGLLSVRVDYEQLPDLNKNGIHLDLQAFNCYSMMSN